MKITIAVPTKNEQETIKPILKECRPFADELLVVDGHSTDQTRELAEDMGAKVILDNGKGKGDGVRVAIKEATGDVILFIDADGSHETKDIPQLVEPILKGKADLVIGSRAKGGSDEFEMEFNNLIRQVGGHIVTTIINYRWGVRLTDIQNGFRAIRLDVARNLNLKANDFDIEQEMVMKCLKKGYKISEISSHEYLRKAGHSKLPTRKGWKFVWRLIKELI